MSIIIKNDILCPLCGSGNVGEYFKLSDRFGGNGELYLIYECGDCSFIFLYPLPSESEMHQFYSNEGYDPFIEVEGSKSLSQSLYELAKPFGLRWKSRLIRKYHPEPGKILDVGAGTGLFLKYLNLLGWSVKGIEKDPSAARYAREKLNLDVYIGDLANVDNLEGPFDIITFWHSLEHIHRFKENIELAADLLIDNGYLFIALPNPASLDAKVYREKWVAWDVPRHLWHFRPQAVKRLLSDFRLRVVETAAMPLDPFYNSLQSEFLIQGGAWWRYPFRLPVVSVCSFLTGLLKGEKGSSITYIAAK